MKEISIPLHIMRNIAIHKYVNDYYLFSQFSFAEMKGCDNEVNKRQYIANIFAM